MEKRKPILCLDFDGVIHIYASPWESPTIIPDPPVPGALEFLQDAIHTFDVQIFSSRSSVDGGIEAMKTWLAEWAAKRCANTSWLASIKWPTVKPPAMLTIDDRAITFDGRWPSIASLLSFKPWNRR